MIALDPRKQVSYIAKCDKDLLDNEQVIFVLKAISIKDEDVIKDALFIRSGDSIRASMSNQQAIALHVGLVDVINLKDHDGNTFVLEYDKTPNEYGILEIKAEFLSRIPASVRSEIARVIIDSLEPSEADRKN
jgi:hypothetical protein